MQRALRLLRRPLPAALVAAILLVGFSTTGLLVWLSERAIADQHEEVMTQRAQVVGDAVRAQVRRYTDTISDLALAAGAQDRLTTAGWATLTSRMNRQQLPGATGSALVVPASDGDVAAVQARWRGMGESGLTLQPAKGQKDHLFVVLTSSVVPPARGDGWDLSPVVAPADAMRLAREHRQVTASSTYVLLRDRGLPKAQQQLSFVLAAPVYGGRGTTHAGQFEGWIVTALRGGDFISQTMRTVSQSTLAVTMFDASTPATASVPVARQSPAPALSDPRYRRYENVEVGGRTWRLLIQPTAALFATTGISPVLDVALAGVLLTLMLAALVASLSFSRERALRMVEQATVALRADIARREAIESQLREREAELEAFAGVVAHDLKSPLTGVAGYADILHDQHGAHLDDLGQRCVAKIVSGAGRMRNLIDDLLTYASARDARLNLQPVMLGDLVTEVLADRLDGCAEPPAVEVGPLPMVMADPAMLRQVLDNLVGNALKYVPAGDVPYVSVTACPGPSGWRVEIADRGIGIAEADHARVFESFRRVRGSEGYAGTGLGLAICERIVRRHGGQIGVEANPGGGSRFWFVLPHLAHPTDAENRQPEIDEEVASIYG